MANLEAFTYEPRPLERFVELPYRMHRGRPHWIPPLREQLLKQLAPSNPYFEHGRLKHFLLTRGGDPIARTTAFLDDTLREHDAPIGLIGLFETIDDHDAAGAVLSAAMDWLKTRGARQVLAPVDFSIWHRYRFRTGAHGALAYSGEPTNPPYYPDLLERQGFTPSWRYRNTPLTADLIRTVEERCKPAYAALAEQGYRFRTLDLSRVDEDFQRIHRLLVHNFRDFVGWTKLSFEEFAFNYGGLKHFMDPALIHFAFDPAGEEVGFMLTLPDIGDAVRAMNGRTHAVAKVRFLWRRRRCPRAMVSNMGGIVDRARGSGVGSALMHLLHKAARQRGYTGGQMGISADDNLSVRWAPQAETDRRYTLYRISL